MYPRNLLFKKLPIGSILVPFCAGIMFRNLKGNPPKGTTMEPMGSALRPDRGADDESPGPLGFCVLPG